MALPPSRHYVQDMPPKGGFPAVPYRRFAPRRGPSAMVIVFGAVGVTTFGLWYAMRDNRERECVAVFRVLSDPFPCRNLAYVVY